MLPLFGIKKKILLSAFLVFVISVGTVTGTNDTEHQSSSEPCPQNSTNCNQCPPDDPSCPTSHQCPPNQPNCQISHQCPPDQPNCQTSHHCPPDQSNCQMEFFNLEMILHHLEAMMKNITKNELAEYAKERLPQEYPQNYYELLKRSFPRRDFTCPPTCKMNCAKRSPCFAKDYMYNFSLPFMRSASVKMARRGMVLMSMQGLDAFDDYISCEDMKKILLFFDTVSVRQQLDIIFHLKHTKQSEVIQTEPMFNSTSQIDDIKPYTKFLHFLTDTALQGIITSLSSSAKLDVCRQLKYLDCRAKLMFLKQYGFEVCSSSATAFVPSARFVRQFLIDRDGDPRQWNDTVWSNNIQIHGPQILEDRNMLRIFPNTLFFNLMQSSGGAKVCKEVEKNVKQLINQKLTQVLKETQDEGQKTLAIKLLQGCGGNLKQMKKYVSKAQILQTFDSSSAKMSIRDKAAMRRILKEEKSDPSSMTSEEIVQYSSLIMNDVRMLSRLNASALEDAICEIGNRTTDISKARKLKTVLERLDNYKDLSVYTKEKILCLKNLLGTLSPTQVNEIPTTPLGEAISEGALNNVDFNCQVARGVLKKYYSYLQKENGDLESSQLLGLPRSIKVCLRPMDIQKIPDSQITLDVINDLRNVFESGRGSAVKATIRKIIGKIRNNGTILIEVAKTSLGKYIPSSWLRQSVDMGQQIVDGLQSGQPFSIKADCKKARYLYGELTRIIGIPDVSNINWTNEVFITLKDSNILSGMPLKHLRNISDSQIFEVSDAFLSSKCLSGNQKKLILKKYMNVQQVDSSTVTTEDIENMDPEILFNQNEEQLSEYGAEHLDDICSVIGQIDVTTVPLEKIKSKAHFCSHCMDLTTISADNMTNCGALMCALPLASFDGFTADVLAEQVGSLAVDCQWGHRKRRKLVELAIGSNVINPPHNMTDIDLMTIKTLVADLTPQEIAVIPSESFQLADSLIEAFKERQVAQKNRRQSGFKNDFTTEERLKQKEGTVEIFKRIIEIKLAGINTRRKRATSNSSLTCSDIQDLGSVGLPVLSVAVLTSLVDNEFSDCLTTFGQVTEWSSEQKVALSEKMETIYGSVSNWTSETISSAGTIIQGFNESVIEVLNVDRDSISTLGEKEGWTKPQEQAAFTGFMNKVKAGGQPSSLTGSDLTSLGKFVCGMSASEINTISPSAYLEASDAVGLLTNCDENQLKAFATLAKNSDVYGSNVGSWDGATVSSVGIVVGGLSQDEISVLTSDQIDSIAPNQISFLPVLVLSYFTPDQLENFSAAQAQSTTTAQRSHLNYNQFTKLEASGDITWESERPENGGMPLKPVLEVTVALLFVYCVGIF